MIRKVRAVKEREKKGKKGEKKKILGFRVHDSREKVKIVGKRRSKQCPGLAWLESGDIL